MQAGNLDISSLLLLGIGIAFLAWDLLRLLQMPPERRGRRK